jgi:hypothetical protein
MSTPPRRWRSRKCRVRARARERERERERERKRKGFLDLRPAGWTEQVKELSKRVKDPTRRRAPYRRQNNLF